MKNQKGGIVLGNFYLHSREREPFLCREKIKLFNMLDSPPGTPSKSAEIREIIHNTKMLIGDIEKFLNTKKIVKGVDSQ